MADDIPFVSIILGGAAIVGVLILANALNNKANMQPAIVPVEQSAATGDPGTGVGNFPATGGAGGGCPPGLYEKLPLAFRNGALRKIKDCVTLRGKVTYVHYCASDGDGNFNVLPDPGYESLLLPGNSSSAFVKKYPMSKGNVHCENVCACGNSSSDPLKKTMCKDGQVWPKLPKVKVGDHVEVVGAHIEDVREEQKAEIHPVWSVKVIG